VDAAFLVVAGKRPGAVRDHHRHAVDSAEPAHLGFRPGAHVSWRHRSGELAFGAWQLSPVDDGELAWHIDTDQVVMSAGEVRWRGRTCQPEGDWARQLARATQRAPLIDIVERLHGVFALVQIGAGGRVAAVTDPLGLRCLYYGETSDIVAISSKAAMVAGALVDSGEQSARDALSAAWLAFTTYRVGTATGYAGVRVLPAGAALEVAPLSAATVVHRTPWLAEEDLRGVDRDELVDQVRDDIADTLSATLERPVDRHVIRLTGGKDSRLLLAVALWAGLARDFRYETIGPPDLADVRVASELAQTFGLRHDVKFLDLASRRSYPDRVNRFISTTGGMLNVWDLSEPSVPPGELSVVGLCGETLRTFRRVKRPMSSTDDLVTHFKGERRGRLGLLHTEVARQLSQLAVEDLADDASGRAQPLDLLDAYYFRNRLRFSRMGPQEELAGQRRIVPLYSIHALRVAFALGGGARQSELLHFEIMRRCSEQLVAHPFAGAGWDPALPAKARPTGRHPLTPAEARWNEPAPATKSSALMQTLQAAGFDDRKEFFRSALHERGNPIWDLVNREATEGALHRFHFLTPPERRELYGALTAALWMRQT
jgi:hypothetical protein